MRFFTQWVLNMNEALYPSPLTALEVVTAARDSVKKCSDQILRVDRADMGMEDCLYHSRSTLLSCTTLIVAQAKEIEHWSAAYLKLLKLHLASEEGSDET